VFFEFIGKKVGCNITFMDYKGIMNVEMNKGVYICIILLFLLSISTVYAAEIHVGSQNASYTSIQNAITTAQSGDTIFVHHGFYNEAVEVYKTVKLIGINHPVLSYSGPDDIVSITADNCLFDGFILQNGTNTSFSGLNIESDYNVIRNNTFRNITGNGLYLFYAKNNTLSDNRFFSNGISIIGSQNDWTTHTIINNTVNALPIYFFQNQQNLSIRNLSAGQIICANCSFCIIANNSISESGEGITLGYSDHSQINQNTLSNNRIGLRIQYSSNNTISTNTFSENRYGIYITHSFDNELVKNSILNNSAYGCWICCNSKRNQLYRNFFSMNANSAYDIFDNTWFKDGVGNYWSDYRGTDTDQDGIGDTAYEILPVYADSTDPYPVVSFDRVDSSSQKNESPTSGILLLLFFLFIVVYWKKKNKK